MLAVYGTLLVVTIGTVVANNWSGHPADQFAVAKPAGEKMQTSTTEASASAKHATRSR